MAWRIPFPRVRSAQFQARDVQVHRACDSLSGILICGMVLFCPWAFGTTQPWSIWTMNLGGYALGLLLIVKLWVRDSGGNLVARWLRPENKSHETALSGVFTRANIERILVGTCGLLLLYILVSAVNARASYVPSQLSFDYHHPISWLPHSLDGTRTWRAFWSYSALACAFWAMRDWLLGMSEVEERLSLPAGAPAGSRHITSPFPRRLHLLLWLLAINGGLLALEGIIQRLEGSGRLLFLVQPRVNPEAVTQFGPWAYRANAAAWFNLLWPVCLGFWWTLHRHHGSHKKLRHHWLLICALLMAACPIISTSRGGALVTLGLVALASFYLLITTLFFQVSRLTRRLLAACVLVSLFSVGALGLGLLLGWKTLAPRMTELSSSIESREQMYDHARPMARDYPIYGTGAGTFATVFQLYRISPDTYWPAQLHNDWLETRITFGWAGSTLIALALGCVFLRCFSPGHIHGHRRFIVLTWLALAGCLVHARYDFPLQIYSVLFLFLTHCSVLMALSWDLKPAALCSTRRTDNSSSSHRSTHARHSTRRQAGCSRAD